MNTEPRVWPCLLLLVLSLAFAPAEALRQNLDTIKAMAETDDSVAQYNLRFCYQNGDGVSRGDTHAVKSFRKAAEQGEPYAQNDLGGAAFPGLCPGGMRDAVGVLNG